MLGIGFNQEILKVVIIFVVIFLVGLIVIKFLHNFLKKIAKKTKTTLDDLFVEQIVKYLFFVLLIISLKYSLSFLNIDNEIIHNILNSLIYIFLAIASVKLFDLLILIWKEKVSMKLTFTDKEKIERAIFPILNKILKVAIWVVYLLIILSDWNINITPVLGGLGLAGLALSLAAKDTLENIFAGLFLATDKSFKVDDIVDLPELGISGRIYDIGLRSTKIKTWDNELLIIPNSKVANAVIKNNMYPDLKARVVIDFSVAYGSNVEKVKKVVINVIRKIEHVIKDPEPQVIMTKMADYGLIFQVKFWVDNVENRYTAKITAIEEIYKALRRNKIEIPYPTYDINLKNTKNA